MRSGATKSAPQAQSAGATVIYGGIHATLYPEEAQSLGGAHAVVKGDGDQIWAVVLDDAARGTLRPVYEAGRIDADQFVAGALGPAPRGTLHVGLGADRPRLPEALLVLLGLAHRRPETASAPRRRGGRRDRRAPPPRLPVRRARRRQFLPGDAVRPGDGRTPAQYGPPRAAEGAASRAIRADGQAGRLPSDMVFFTQITMEAAEDDAFLDAMRRAHIKGALVGVEAVTPEGLKDVYKGFNDSGEALVTRLRMFRERGVHVLGSFIFGLPSDRAGDVRGHRRHRGPRRPDLRAVRDADALSGTVDFAAWEKKLGNDPDRIGGIPVTRHWLIPQAQRPKVYTPHPVMSGDEIRARTQAVWDTFYSLPRVWARSRCLISFRSRVAFVLISKLYRQMYANTGIATDSARVNRANRWARLIAGPCRRLFAAKPMPDLPMPAPSAVRLPGAAVAPEPAGSLTAV